ncbi:MAG: hypothetical protein JWR61_1041 [Ferruginibacter sp.]|uniref:hypothetical protein n=1 Tax=Ferruginibacter sp. TaxID=1940288 RepID=UPI00265AA203|nr:hypothetical protein [Ferruginibacter sp.]MDB5276086.1 hypothetical protein [Ferruginibacter sp.]
MKALKILRCVTGLILMIVPELTKASDGKPVIHFVMISKMQTDTVPPKATVPDNTVDMSAENVIKEVPKSRKQPVPIPVIKVIPVKIIKPKIIKPVIKIIH